MSYERPVVEDLGQISDHVFWVNARFSPEGDDCDHCEP